MAAARAAYLAVERSGVCCGHRVDRCRAAPVERPDSRSLALYPVPQPGGERTGFRPVLHVPDLQQHPPLPLAAPGPSPVRQRPGPRPRRLAAPDQRPLVAFSLVQGRFRKDYFEAALADPLDPLHPHPRPLQRHGHRQEPLHAQGTEAIETAGACRSAAIGISNRADDCPGVDRLLAAAGDPTAGAAGEHPDLLHPDPGSSLSPEPPASGDFAALDDAVARLVPDQRLLRPGLDHGADRRVGGSLLFPALAGADPDAPFRSS